MLVGLPSDIWSHQLAYNCVLENWEQVLQQTEDKCTAPSSCYKDTEAAVGLNPR